MLIRTKLSIACGMLLAAALPAPAQDFNPPPGFSPSAPRAAAPSGGPGVLQRLGGSSGQDSFDSGENVFNTGDPYVNPPAAAPFSTPDSAHNFNGGGTAIPYSQPMIPAPSYYVPRFWIKAEALYWWTKSSPLPVPVITAGSLSDPIPGALGQPGTQVLIGNEGIGLPGRGGGRFTLGFALDPESVWAVEGSYFFLSSVLVSQGVSSDGFPGSATLAIPYFNPLPNGTIASPPASPPPAFGENATFLSLPGSFAGTAVLSLQSFVQGAEANALFNMSNAAGWRWDGLVGFRYLNLQEVLTLSTDSPNVPPNPADVFTTFDRFSAQNNFYGGQFGARATYENPYMFFNGTAKLALGSTIEHITTTGALFSSSGSAPGAYFTQPTNLGSFSQSQFALIPGVDLNFGIRLSPWASVVVGYSFLYVSSVARPGDQIDRTINPTQAPAIYGGTLVGPARPTMVMHDTDFWVQGLTFSLELRY